jgi:DNA-binding response OmpR family regulator
MAARKKLILIIDDEKDILDSLSGFLERNGYEVSAADNGQDGLKLAHDQRPDLVILDLILPDIDGSDIAARLLEDPLTSRIPVIFLTSIMRKSEQEKVGRTAGNRQVVAKPCSPEEILACVKDTIGPA